MDEIINEEEYNRRFWNNLPTLNEGESYSKEVADKYREFEERLNRAKKDMENPHKTTAEINEFAAQRLVIDTGIDELCAKLQRSRMEFLEHLTETQFLEIITQMIKSGDFVRFIHENGQQLSYVPFRGRAELEKEIERLKGVLALHELAAETEKLGLYDDYFKKD